jgi:hypothetical protein
MPGYHQSPANTCAIEQEITARTSNNTQVNGNGVDMQGWDGVLFILNLGTIDAAVDMALFSDTTSAFSSATAVTGAAITQVPATGDGQIVAIDLYRPTERHVRARITVASGTTGAALSVTSMRYRATGRLPITQTLDELVKVAEN